MLITKNLNVSIAGKQICRDLNFEIKSGQCWGMLGRNGIGKTTLLHTLSNLRPADAGSIQLNNRPILSQSRQQIAREIGVLLQDNFDPFPSTVLETALIGRHPYIPAWKLETDQDIKIAKEALNRVDLSALASRQVSTLSGGERQRLSIATLLTQGANLYLLDEPTNHLDLHYQIKLLAMLKETQAKQNGAILMALHDVNLMARFCDHIILLFGDGNVEFGTCDALLTEENLQRLYQHKVNKIPTQHGMAFIPN